MKPYEDAAHKTEGVAHSFVEYGLNVAEASLTGAGEVLSEVSKSIGRIRESLTGRNNR